MLLQHRLKGKHVGIRWFDFGGKKSEGELPSECAARKFSKYLGGSLVGSRFDQNLTIFCGFLKAKLILIKIWRISDQNTSNFDQKSITS